MSDSPPVRLEPDERFLRRAEVLQICGLSKSELYRRIERGEFPSSRPLAGSHIVFWLASEVRQWQAKMLAAVT